MRRRKDPRPGANPSALQPKTLGFALHCAGRGALLAVSPTAGSASAITRHGCCCLAPRKRGHPLAAVNTRTVKSATLGREGGFQVFAPCEAPAGLGESRTPMVPQCFTARDAGLFYFAMREW